jgi:hypothetical protein
MFSEVKNFKFVCDRCQKQVIVRDAINASILPPKWVTVNHDNGAGYIKVEDVCRSCAVRAGLV